MARRKRQFRIPGPVQVPARVRKAVCEMMKNPIGHRSKEFAELLYRVTDKLKKIAKTKNDLFIFNSAGTGGMQAALTNSFQVGEEVLFITNGFFGERFLTIGETQRLDVKPLMFPWGRPVDLEMVETFLKREKNLRGVVMVFNETSTAITNNVAEVAKMLKNRDDILFIVDANSGLGAIDLPIDDLKIDIVMFTSQKALMCPPGAMMLTVSEKVWRKINKISWQPREHYFSFEVAKREFERGQTFGTPVVPTIAGLDVATDMILNEGLDKVFARHTAVASKMRELMKEQFELLAPESHASATVTAVKWPGSAQTLMNFMETLDTNPEYNLKVAGGQDKLNGRIFRIGHMGDITLRDVYDIAKRIKKCFNTLSSDN